MSLRARIVLLFLGFSVAPVFLLGLGDYYQSVEALREVLTVRSEVLAEQVAREVETAHERAMTAAINASFLPSLDGPVGPFSHVAVSELDDPTNSVPGCRVDDTVPVRVGIGGENPETGSRIVEGALPVGTLLEWAPALRTRLGNEGFVQVLDLETGMPLFDSRCGEATRRGGGQISMAVDRLRNMQDGHIALRYGSGGDEVVASISAAGPAWAVAVGTRSEEFIAPFRQARIYYLGLVLLVMALAGVAFLLLAQGAFKSLRVVTAAADQIELGNLRPWLPPPGRDEVGRLSLAFRKMTERLEESVRRTELNQKLAAVGEMATYLSHEIRNPLSSIRLSLQSLHRDVQSGFIPSDSPRVIEIALGEVKRLDAVVRAVLEMGRPAGETAAGTCEVHATLEETLDVLRPRMKAQRIELEYVPNASTDIVQGDAAGLRSVVINLAVNAMDALDRRGDGRIRISTWSDGENGLHVRVADNGHGIDPEVAGSIFEPFFTTKARGNGIGLPTALRTVQPWGGTITHEPVAAGSGAVFVIKLKLADPPSAEPAPEENLTTAQAQ